MNTNAYMNYEITDNLSFKTSLAYGRDTFDGFEYDYECEHEYDYESGRLCDHEC